MIFLGHCGIPKSMSNWQERHSELSKRAAASEKATFESEESAADGEHSHLIRMKDGSVLQTGVSNGHLHEHTHDEEKPVDGEHTHTVRMEDGSIIETRKDGMHRHPKDYGPFVGVHSHILDMPDGTIVETQIDGVHHHYNDYHECCKGQHPVAKALPAEAGVDIVDQSGWTTTFKDPVPGLPASNSIHYDTDETLSKAAKVVAEIKATKEQSEQ